MKILVAEDDRTSAFTLEQLLKQSGYQVVVTRDGAEALEAIHKQQFDALLTDWLMPRMDGIQLTHQARTGPNPVPIIIFTTILDSPQARAHALHAGADDYLTKPYQRLELLKSLSNCLLRHRQEPPQRRQVVVPPSGLRPPFIGVCIAASTGGPTALREVLKNVPESIGAPVFVVQHGPAWMLESLASHLEEETHLTVSLAEDGLQPRPGRVYLAPAEKHLGLNGDRFTLQLLEAPPENYVRPAADPLFRSAAAALGRHCLAVILTGMGRDGSAGAEHVAAAGGTLLVQDPSTATATSMPRTAMNLGLPSEVVPLARIGDAIRSHVRQLSTALATVG